jgi:hypothetical protein
VNIKAYILFLKILIVFLSKFLVVLSLKTLVVEFSKIEIFTTVSPFSSKKFCISLSCDLDDKFKVISLIELLKRSFNEAIFLTLILLFYLHQMKLFLLKLKLMMILLLNYPYLILKHQKK